MSKKPLNGHSCAACEHYIGDLNEAQGSSYIPYHKMQTKDIEKQYRVNKYLKRLLKLYIPINI